MSPGQWYLLHVRLGAGATATRRQPFTPALLEFSLVEEKGTNSKIPGKKITTNCDKTIVTDTGV